MKNTGIFFTQKYDSLKKKSKPSQLNLRGVKPDFSMCNIGPTEAAVTFLAFDLTDDSTDDKWNEDATITVDIRGNLSNNDSDSNYNYNKKKPNSKEENEENYGMIKN